MGQSNQRATDRSSDLLHRIDILPFVLTTLEFVEWKERGRTFNTCKRLSELGRLNVTQHWLCYRLSIEHKLYVSAVLGELNGWAGLFRELYPLRHTWTNIDETQEPRRGQSETFKVNVFVRFKPSVPKLLGAEAAGLAKVTLPLHQRMALIRISHGLRSNKEVLQVLMKEGSWFGPKWTNAKSKKSSRSPQKPTGAVPPIEKELHAGVQSLDPELNNVIMVTPDVGMREFRYDGVFPVDVSQIDVYNKIARRLVMDCLNGFNTTAIVYGQTGSGKN